MNAYRAGLISAKPEPLGERPASGQVDNGVAPVADRLPILFFAAQDRQRLFYDSEVYMKPFYADIADLEEDERIDLMGRIVEDDGKTVSFVVETPEKADRYISKLEKRFKLRVVSRGIGPIPNTCWVKIGPLAH